MSLKQNLSNIVRFNRWSHTYGQDRLSRCFTQGQNRVLDALQLKADDCLLDVGCGTGWAVAQAACRLPGGRVCGIDLSPGMIARARELTNGFARIEFQVADAEAIPYPTASFDAVMCTHSFHHYSDPIRALAEIYRVLKPGGQCVLLDPNRAGCLWIRLWDRVLRTFEKGHVQYYTEAELVQLLRKTGYTNIVVSSDHGHFRYGKIAWAMSLIQAVHR